MCVCVCVRHQKSESLPQQVWANAASCCGSLQAPIILWCARAHSKQWDFSDLTTGEEVKLRDTGKDPFRFALQVCVSGHVVWWYWALVDE